MYLFLMSFFYKRRILNCATFAVSNTKTCIFAIFHHVQLAQGFEPPNVGPLGNSATIFATAAVYNTKTLSPY